MKKVLSYLGWILFAVTLIAMFWIAKPSATVDFSGVVKSIEYNEQENCTYMFKAYLLSLPELLELQQNIKLIRIFWLLILNIRVLIIE